MRSPRKILYSSSKPSLSGGGQKSLLLLFKHLDRARFNPILLCPAEGDLSAAARSMDIKTLIMDVPALVRLNVFIIMKLFRLIKNERIDMIHTDGPRHTFYLGIAAYCARLPLIWHVRVSTPEPYLYERLLYSLSTRIISVSHAAARRFKHMPEFKNKVSVIHTAVDLDEYHLMDDSLAVGIRTAPRIGIIGRIEPEKGTEDFIKAAAIVLKKHPSVRYLIAGEGNSSFINYLKNSVLSLSISDKIEFVGYQKEVRPFIAGLSILVNASKFIGKTGGEGLPRVVIEAMSLGKPVVATDVGGNSEAVVNGQTGIIVPPDDSSALAQAIMTLLSNVERMKMMGRKGRERVVKCFEIRSQARTIESLYEKIFT